MAAKLLILTSSNSATSQPIDSEMRVSRAQVRLTEYIENHDEFSSKVASRAIATAGLTSYKATPEFQSATKELHDAKTGLRIEQQKQPNTTLARQQLGPFYFFRDSAYATYVKESPLSSIESVRSKTLGGIALSTVGKVSLPVGAAVLGLTGIQKAITDEPYRMGVGSVAGILIASSFLIPNLPASLKLGTWQSVGYTRVKAKTEEQRKSVNIATAALLDSYVDPILAVSAQAIGMQITKNDLTLWLVALGGLAATQLTSYLSMRLDKHSVIFQKSTDALAVIFAATLIGLTFGLDRNKFKPSANTDITTASFLGAVVAPAIAAYVTAASYYVSFLNHRVQVKETLAVVAGNTRSEAITVAQNVVAKLEEGKIFKEEKRLVHILEKATSEASELGDILSAKKENLMSALEILNHLGPAPEPKEEPSSLRSCLI